MGKTAQIISAVESPLFLANGVSMIKNTILVIGSSSDKVIQFFAKNLQQSAKKSFCLIDQDLFGNEVHVDDCGWRLASGRSVRHECVSGVWNRLLSLEDDDQSVKHQIERFACYLMDEVYCQVLNRPKHGMSNHAKQYQIGIIETVKLKKIESYICANDRLSWGFYRQALIRKSMSSIRSIVDCVAEDEKFLWVQEPELFQRYISGLNLRVHVLGEIVIACSCESSYVDYRYGNDVYISRIQLPKWLEQECIDINKQLALPFTGIDIIKSDDNYYLLEVNPAPGYAYFDVDSSISYALAQYFR